MRRYFGFRAVLALGLNSFALYPRRFQLQRQIFFSQLYTTTVDSCIVKQTSALCAGGTAEALIDLSVVETVELLCNRTFTAVQYAKALLQRAQEIECLNVYAVLDPSKVGRQNP